MLAHSRFHFLPIRGLSLRPFAAGESEGNAAQLTGRQRDARRRVGKVRVNVVDATQPAKMRYVVSLRYFPHQLIVIDVGLSKPSARKNDGSGVRRYSW